MRLYFDTAYIAKCYLNEADAKSVRRLASRATGLYSSSWCIAEIACVFHRKFREATIDMHEASAIRSQFLTDVRNGVWSLQALTERLLYQVESFTAGLGPTVYVRAGDAVHIVTAQQAGFTEIWTNDRHLAAAAEQAGLSARKV